MGGGITSVMKYIGVSDCFMAANIDRGAGEVLCWCNRSRRFLTRNMS